MAFLRFRVCSGVYLGVCSGFYSGVCSGVCWICWVIVETEGNCGTFGLWDLWTVSNTLRKACFFSGIHIALIMASRSQRAMAFNAGTVSLRKSKQRVDDRSRCYARPMETAPYETRSSVPTTAVASTQEQWRRPVTWAG